MTEATRRLADWQFGLLEFDEKFFIKRVWIIKPRKRCHTSRLTEAIQKHLEMRRQWWRVSTNNVSRIKLGILLQWRKLRSSLADATWSKPLCASGSLTKNFNKKQPPTLQKLLDTQYPELKIRPAVRIVDKPRRNLIADIGSFPVLIATLNVAVQLYISAAHHPVILHLYQYSVLVGHLEEWHMYDTIPTQ